MFKLRDVPHTDFALGVGGEKMLVAPQALLNILVVARARRVRPASSACQACESALDWWERQKLPGACQVAAGGAMFKHDVDSKQRKIGWLDCRADK